MQSDPLHGSAVFNCNASILFEKKVVGHVTILDHVTTCLLRLLSANAFRDDSVPHTLLIKASVAKYT